MSENTRFGLYFLVDAILFWLFAGIALRRLVAAANWRRFSILAFAVSFGAFFTQVAIIRLGLTDTALATGWHSEAIRAGMMMSLAWMTWEYATRRRES